MNTFTHQLTVIIPCYNEAERLSRFFTLIKANLELDWEWLFVDDGSRDTTANTIDDFRSIAPQKITLITLPHNQGKGRAVREGLLQAQGRMVGYVDADLAASPLLFKDLIEEPEIASGRELLIGIRVKTQDGKVHRLLYRHYMGRVFQTYTSIITGLSVYDTQCGFKLMETGMARKIARQMICLGFAFDVELILLAMKFGMKIREEMIPWQEQGDSRIRPRHIFNMAMDILRIAKRIKQLPCPAGNANAQ